MIASHTLLDVALTSRTRSGWRANPLLTCLFSFVFGNETMDEMSAVAELKQASSRWVCFQIFLNHELCMGNRTGRNGAMPIDRIQTAPYGFKGRVVYQVYLQNAQKLKEHAGHCLNESHRDSGSIPPGFWTRAWQNGTGQCKIVGSTSRGLADKFWVRLEVRLTSFKLLFWFEPSPTLYFSLRDNSSYFLFWCQPSFLDTNWVWAPNTVDITLRDTHLPEVLQTGAAKDMSTRKLETFMAFEVG